MTSPDLLQMFRARSCSRQWLGFVRAMGEEFASELPEQELATLMSRIGLRFANQHRLSAGCSVLQQVEQEANRVWDAADWGACQMVEHPNYVDIRHYAAPITVALDAVPWSDGFLEGVYQGWFQQLGMLAGLSVRAVRPEVADVRRFTLARSL